MIREQLLEEWNSLKVKFNQLSGWTKTFPNQRPLQIQSKINTLQSNYLSSFETIKQKNTKISNLTSEVNLWQEELNKETSWWDKWISDDGSYMTNRFDVLFFKLPNGEESYCLQSDKTVFKNIIKNNIYQYYRDK